MLGMIPTPLPITIRRATQADLPTLHRLAQLDSQRLTPGPHLVAERDGGDLIAAVDLHDARWFANPFEPTADAVSLLQEHATHITAPRPSRSLTLLRGLFPAPAPRRA
jgi:hypothetical protein